MKKQTYRVTEGEYTGWTTQAVDKKTAQKNFVAMCKRQKAKSLEFTHEELEILSSLLELNFTGIPTDAKKYINPNDKCEYFMCDDYDKADKLHDKIIALVLRARKKEKVQKWIPYSHLRNSKTSS